MALGPPEVRTERCSEKVSEVVDEGDLGLSCLECRLCVLVVIVDVIIQVSFAVYICRRSQEREKEASGGGGDD